MKTLIMLFLITSCATSELVQNPNKRPKYAPKNYVQTGQVKYLSEGWDSVIEDRREDAFKQMHELCNGDFEIIKEYKTSTSATATNIGYGMTRMIDGDNYVFIDFKCSDKIAKQ